MKRRIKDWHNLDIAPVYIRFLIGKEMFSSSGIRCNIRSSLGQCPH
jgi:hypothetical protein